MQGGLGQGVGKANKTKHRWTFQASSQEDSPSIRRFLCREGTEARAVALEGQQ